MHWLLAGLLSCTNCSKSMPIEKYIFPYQQVWGLNCIRSGDIVCIIHWPPNSTESTSKRRCHVATTKYHHANFHTSAVLQLYVVFDKWLAPQQGEIFVPIVVPVGRPLCECLRVFIWSPERRPARPRRFEVYTLFKLCWILPMTFAWWWRWPTLAKDNKKIRTAFLVS